MPHPIDGVRPRSHDIGQQLKGAGPRQIDTETLQHLARFLQSSEPPITDIAAIETGAAWKRPRQRSPRRKRWSVQSLRIGKAAKSRKQAASRLSRDVIGYPYNLVHTTLAGEKQELIDLASARKKLGHRSSAPPRPPRPSIIEPGWPLRTSSMQDLAQPSVGGFNIDPERLLLQPETEREQNRLSVGPADSPRSSRASYLWMYGDVLRFLNTSPGTEKDDPISGTRPALTVQPNAAQAVDEPRPVIRIPGPLADTNTESAQLPTPIEVASPSVTPPKVHLRTASKAGSLSSSNISGLSDPAISKPLPALRPFPSKATATPTVILTQDKAPVLSSSRSSPSLSRPKSPAKKIKRPANIAAVASSASLNVDVPTPWPESPGFPAMLGAMTFPSPPESVASPLSIRSSPSSADLLASLPSSPLAQHDSEPTWQPLGIDASEAVSQELGNDEQQSNLGNQDGEETLIHKSQPTVSIDILAEATKVDEQPMTDLVNGINGIGNALGISSPVAAEASIPEPTTDPSASPHALSTDEPSPSLKNVVPSPVREKLGSHVSTQVAVYESHSRGPRPTQEQPHLSKAQLDKVTESTFKPNKAHSMTGASESGTSSGTPSGSRSQTPNSSSTLTDNPTPAQGLAERRMARRAKVKALINKRASLSRPPNLQVTDPATLLSDAVDSPVLGWFSPHAPKEQVSDRQSQHPLAEELVTTPTEVVQGAKSPERAPTRSSRSRGHASHKSNGGASYKSGSSRAYHSAHSSESSLCSFITASMNGGEPDEEECDEENPRSRTPEFTLSSVTVLLDLANSPPKAQRPQTFSAFSTQSSSKKAKRASALRPLSLLTLDSTPRTTSPAASSPTNESKPAVRHRPIPIRISRDIPERCASPATRKSNRKSFPSVLTPPLSPDLLSPSLRTNHTAAARAARLEESFGLNPLDMIPKEPDVAPMTREEETAFLRNYQQETARAWRLAALRKRISSGRTEMEQDISNLNNDTQPEADLSEEPSPETDTYTDENQELDPPDSPAPELKPKSSKRQLAQEALPASVHLFKHSRQNALGSIADFEVRHEKNSDDWVSAMMPLLDNMNRMLRDMQMTNVRRGTTTKATSGSMATL
ncbi:hypothetical protein LIA77_02963 [Sarocladium implicatum]|nr:hypothetical protein LIA77_02963 [Sarocladium implicatum]